MPVDILIDIANAYDLRIEDGDLVSGESTRQHQALLLLTEKGENREFPARGIGLQSWLNDDRSGDLNAAIKREFERDGMKVISIRGTIENLTTEAVYP